MRAVFGALWQYQRRVLTRFFQEKSPARLIVAAAFGLVFLGVGLGTYLFFKAGFALIKADDLLRNAISLYVFELFFLIIFYFVMVSAFFTGIFRWFRNRCDAWIMASPRFAILWVYYYLKVFISSLWPFLLLALPALWAMKAVFDLNFLNFILALTVIGLIVALALAIAVISLFFLMKLVSYLPSGSGPALNLGRLVVLAVVFLTGVAYFSWRRAIEGDFFQLLGVQNFTAATVSLEPISQRFSPFPTHLAARGLLALQNNDLGGALPPAVYLFFLVIASLGALWLVSRWFLSFWQIFQEGQFEAGVKIGRSTSAPIKFPRYLKGQIGVLFEKEALMTWREIRNLTQFIFLFFLWLIQTGLNLTFKAGLTKYQLRSTMIPQVVIALQVVALVYFICAFALRFALPSFSTERKTVWIIGSAPLDLVRVFYAKFLFFASVFSALGAVVSLINAAIFNMTQDQTGAFLVFSVVVANLVVGLGMSLGALFPNFETDDPELLSTSLPGLGFILVSLIYGGAGAFVFYLFLQSSSRLSLAAFEVLSVLVLAFLLAVVPRYLKRLEFVKVRQ